MNEPQDLNPSDEDPTLDAAGARLRARAGSISAAHVETSALRRRTRRLGAGLGASLVATAVLGGLLVARADTGDDDLASSGGGATDGVSAAQVDRLVASLDPQPVDPTRVELVATVSTYADCDGLIGDLRRVGAAHVGSRGFGGTVGVFPDGYAMREASLEYTGEMADAATSAPMTGGADADVTLGTNVQVSGVDELDFVKAVGHLVYDLDGRGNLRITDARALSVLSTLDVTPEGPGDPNGTDPWFPGPSNQVSELLVHEGRVVILGTEVEISEPVEGDPSATRSSTSYLTVTFVDATDPTAPVVTDRVRVEGSLVSARLVDGEIRLVTTSHMADLGFVMPTTPNSVARALEANRRSVAGSGVADWIPDWQRDGEDPQPLVPCERVHVPDTFAGVAMTSMVTFPMSNGRFEPLGTSILAPGTTLYAGLEKVAISSEVWVDPVDRDRLSFDDWQTAIHEFSFVEGGAPGYEGSGLVDGSTVGQFAFGEIDGSLAVVSAEGTPWRTEPNVAVDMTVLTPDGDGGLAVTAQVEDLSDGRGTVTAVRFVPGRVLISTGLFGRVVHVLDVTDPAAPRSAGSVTMPGDVGYFHPLPGDRALTVGQRSDEVGSGDDREHRPWVTVHLLDVSDPDAPGIVSSWERPWAHSSVGGDHHAFTWWPDRELALWGVHNSRWAPNTGPGPNHAVVLGVGEELAEVAVPEAHDPPEAPAPCPTVEVTEAEVRNMIGRGAQVVRCDDPATTEVDWPRHSCWKVDEQTLARFVPEEERGGAWFVCSPASPPQVARVLVVEGRPILLTDQTFEVLDPDTFASTDILYLPRNRGFGPW